MTLEDIQSALKNSLKSQCPPLRISKDNQSVMEVTGTKEVMQGKQKVAGHYFASVVPKAKDIRMYFFPIYTHASEFQLSEKLGKMLKGKSCFHINKLDDELILEIDQIVSKGIQLYQNDQLI